MATAADPASLPPDTARLLEGVFPARLGIQKAAPVPKQLLSLVPRQTGEQIQGYATYKPQFQNFAGFQLLCDLLIFTDRNLYIVPIFATKQFGLSEVPFSFLWYSYDETPRGQCAHLALEYQAVAAEHGFQCAPFFFPQTPYFTPGSDWLRDQPVGTIVNVASVQFDNELIFCAANGGNPENSLWRYYRDDNGDQHLYGIYIPAGGEPTSGGTGVGVLNCTTLAPYQYLWTYVDEQGRESSPSAVMTTGALTNNSQTVIRGTDGAFTCTAALRGWNLYRRNPGATTFNLVAEVPYNVTSYVDNIDDSIVDGGQAAPDDGENDPPDRATYLYVHKSRLYLNNADFFGVLQISNSGSPTQFSSITLPTNTTSGLRLAVGDDADAIITGIHGLGDILWIAKPKASYLLQGDDITNWNLQELGRARGCDSIFTVVRAENELLFKSNDGIYKLHYQYGMVTDKTSWTVDNLMEGFASMLTPDVAQPFGGVFTPAGGTGVSLGRDGNTAGRPIAIQVSSQYTDFVRAFYWQQRYFLCLTDRTLVLDSIEEGAWGDAGLGPVKWPIVIDGTQPTNATGSPSGGLPSTVIFSYGGAFDSDLKVYYFTAADTPWDVDLPTTYKTVVGREVSRSFDDQPTQTRRKRAKFFLLFGKTGKKPGTTLGWMRCFADGRLCGPAIPIRAYQNVRNQSALFECGLPQQMVGNQLWVELEWHTNDWEATNRRMDFVALS